MLFLVKIFPDAGAIIFGLLGASIELVRVRACAYGSHDRTGALLDRETGPDSGLTWQWTLAVVVCAALAGVFKKRKYEIELN